MKLEFAKSINRKKWNGTLPLTYKGWGPYFSLGKVLGWQQTSSL